MKRALELTLLLAIIILLFPSVLTVVDVKAEDSWTTLAPIPEAMNGAKAVAVNGKIYVIGSDKNFEYDPVSNTWTSKKSMPTPRVFFQMAVHENKIYTLGGRQSNIVLGINEVYDPLTDTWSTKEMMPKNTSDVEANVVGDKIHLISTERHDIYDIVTDSWTSKPTNFSHPIYGYSSTVFDNRIYIISPNQTQIYDPVSDSWSQGTPSLTSVQDASACATIGVNALKRIYVVGGKSSASLDGLDIIQVYDPKTDGWAYGTSMPTRRGWLEVVVVEDMLYAIGGNSYMIGPELDVNEGYKPFGYGTPDSSYISPTPPPTEEPQTTEQDLTVGAILAVASIVVFLSLLLYFIRRG